MDTDANIRQETHLFVDEIEQEYRYKLERAVSVVIPAYNEAGHIADQLRSVKQVMEETGWKFEIIVVNDGSSDNTEQEAMIPGVRVLRHRKNRGYGAALKKGIDAASYDWILITDADGTYPNESIPNLLTLAAENEMVVGARTGQTVKIPLSRRPAKWFLGRMASYLAGQRLRDLNSGFRLIRKDLFALYRHLLPSGFSFTTTITLAAACNDHQVEYVPINYYARLGRSKIYPRHAYDFMLLILRTIVFFNPLKVFMPLGGMLACIGLTKFVYDIAHQDLSDSTVMASLGALIVWAIGLLADQNTRIVSHK